MRTGRDALALALLTSAACGGSPPADAVPIETKLARSPDAKVDDGRHRIVLSRPYRVGDRFLGTGKFDETHHTKTVEGATTIEVVERRRGVYLVGEGEVLGVDAHREWTKLRVTVRSAQVTGPRGESELLPAGTVLDFRRKQGDERGESRPARASCLGSSARRSKRS